MAAWAAACVLLLVLLLAACLWTRARSAHARRLAAQLPGPRALPLLGNLRDVGMLTLRPSLEGFLERVTELRRAHGPVFRMWIGPDLFVAVCDPSSCEAILSSQEALDKALNYRFLFPWIGRGLLTSTGAKWRKHRKIITPTLHFNMLEGFVDTMNSKARKLVDKLARHVGGGPFDIQPYVTLCSLDVICETAMRTSVNAMDDQDGEYVRATRSMSAVVMNRSLLPWLQPDFLFSMATQCSAQSKALKVLHGFTNQVLNRRKSEFATSGADKCSAAEENQDLGVKTRKAFIDMLLEANSKGAQMSDEDLQEEVDTFMFEGHDTTGSAIGFALSSLALNPHVQDKLHKELQEIFGDSERDATSEDVRQMKYLEMVVKETLRLFPSVPLYGRHLLKDTVVGDHVFPRGASVIVGTILMHRDPELYPEPLRFDPERFLPENCQRRHPYAYLPFSAGPRNCVGQKFAMLELKVCLSRVLRSYRLVAGSTTNCLDELLPELVLKNRKGINVRIEARR
ncbi:cytochrome P450 4C1-like [Bacillus rossius redtenbacheri]|uniref:cytochrome P450 4C1-like n=1 Tax=Bacillus rossius redtenbacheri TaxID=93214 RepID=UPI002FDD2AB9